MSFDGDLDPEASIEWAADLQQCTIPGSLLDEMVFFHNESKTLILTDTIQNFELNKIKRPYRFLVWAARAYAPQGQAPIDLRSTFMLKKDGVRAAVQTMLAWKPECIVLSHGALIEHDAEQALRFAFRFAL